MNIKRMTVLAALLSLAALTTQATERTWQGPSGGDWFTASNWLPEEGQNYPQADDTVIIPSGASVLLTNETAVLAAFSITNATLTFSNWTTRLRATEVTIENNGTLTLPPPFTEAQMSNRIWVVCDRFTLNAGGGIDADQKGFAGVLNAEGNGPGKGTPGGSNGPGAGHGGKGGIGSSLAAGGGVYDDAEIPTVPGSSGSGSSAAAGGHGGGAVRIEASQVLMNGTISANGGNGAGSSHRSGGGSGGSVYIVCDAFTSTVASAVIRANGGTGWKGNTSVYQSGGGGGGRIAINCAVLDPATVLARFETRAGIGHDTAANVSLSETDRSGMGTLYLPNANLLSPVLSRFGETRIVIPGFDTWNVSSLVISNSTVALGPDGMMLTVTGTLSIVNGGLNLGGLALSTNVSAAVAGASSGTLYVGGAVLMDGGHLCLGGMDSSAYSHMTVGGAMTLTNSARLRLNASITNDTSDAFGARLKIDGGLAIGPGCWIYPFSHATNGGSVIIQAGSVSVSEGGGINANARGFAGRLNDDGLGLGATVKESNTAGAGHGGRGGNRGALTGGMAYDSTNAPVQPGSSAGGTSQAAGGHGGGVIRLEVSGAVVNNGLITANASSGGGSMYRSGGGSGGSIFINCSAFSGTSSAASLSASGGNGSKGNTSSYQSGGGAGGRIAVWSGVPDAARDLYLAGKTNVVIRATTNMFYAGSVSVTNGVGYENEPPNGAEPGTAYFFTPKPVLGSLLIIM